MTALHRPYGKIVLWKLKGSYYWESLIIDFHECVELCEGRDKSHGYEVVQESVEERYLSLSLKIKACLHHICFVLLHLSTQQNSYSISHLLDTVSVTIGWLDSVGVVTVVNYLQHSDYTAKISSFVL